MCTMLPLSLTAACDPCLDNPCNDGLFCNGTEVCAPDTEGGFICADGTPVGCAANEVCDESAGSCLDPCQGVTCVAGEECLEGVCHVTGPCADVTCRDGEQCANGACVAVDPCSVVTCSDSEECVNGRCVRVAPCDDVICDDGNSCNGVETCDARTGECVDGQPVICGEGFECVDGKCARSDLCKDVDCHAGFVCDRDTGACVEYRPCLDIICRQGFTCDPHTGECVEDDEDPDDDGVLSSVDNCPAKSNSDQADSDADAVGDVCDNCPDDWNPDQLDSDGDGTGDVCQIHEAAARTLPACYQPSAPLTVNIRVTPPSGTLIVGIEDTPPSGWTVSNISDDGSWNPDNGKVKWYFIDGDARTVTYELVPASEGSESACFTGNVNFDGGANGEVAGSACVAKCSGA